MEKIVIFGNGKIAQIIYHFVKNTFDVVAFTVDRAFLKEDVLENLPVIAFDEIEKHFAPNDYKMLIAVGYIGMNSVREKKYGEAKAKGYSFVNYIDSSVVWHSNVTIGENNIILDHASVQPFAKIGNSNIIWSGAVVAHGCNVEDNCWITSGVTIAGDSTIKSNCFLGINATIGHNITIERENFIGANVLISRNTKEKEVFISKDGEKFRLDSLRFLQFAGV
ncbi:MAG: transferase [Alphaproteobacteria bacterium]